MPIHRFSSEAIRHAAETGALRGLSNMLSLCALCDRRACRRAQVCLGEPRDCLARYAPLVPPDARDGVKAMIEGLWRGQTFDELYADAPDEVAAIDEWSDAIAAARRKRPKPRP